MNFKKLFSLLLLAISFFASAQDAKPFALDTVLYSNGKDAAALYDATKLWLSTNLDSGSENFTFNYDDEKLVIVGKALLAFKVSNLTWHAMSGSISCTYNIACRDGRVRFVVTDVIHDSVNSGWDEGLIYEEIPAERNKGISGKQHREIYKRVKKQVGEWFVSESVSLSSYLNMYQSIQNEDW